MDEIQCDVCGRSIQVDEFYQAVYLYRESFDELGEIDVEEFSESIVRWCELCGIAMPPSLVGTMEQRLRAQGRLVDRAGFRG